MSIINNSKKWNNPLPDCFWSLPLGKYSSGGFGAQRKFSLHTGIDLMCEHMQPLAAVEDGQVVSIENFSKSKNKSNWLNETRVIMIEGSTGVVTYCNVLENPELTVGNQVLAGEIIGNVVRINKNRKTHDICMLHLELYKHNTKKRVTWNPNYPKPPQLLNPHQFLLEIITDNQSVYKKRK